MKDTEDAISFVQEHMSEGELISLAGFGLLKAFASVLIILGAFIATSYILSLNSILLILSLLAYIIIFVPIYIKGLKITTYKDFFITDKFDSADNFLMLIAAQVLSWLSTVGINLIIYIVVLFWSVWNDPLSQAIFKILCISSAVSLFFIYTKRKDIWTPKGFEIIPFAKYLLMGISFGIGTYALGGIIVLSSELIGWTLTAIGIGLELVFGSVYTYMDIQEMIKKYKRKQEWEQERMLKELPGVSGNA